MTDLEKAARMALEFVEFCWRDVEMNDYALEKREEVETALRQALSNSVERLLCDHSLTRIRKIRNYPLDSQISPHVSVNPKFVKPWMGLDASDYCGQSEEWCDGALAAEAILKEKNIK